MLFNQSSSTNLRNQIFFSEKRAWDSEGYENDILAETPVLDNSKLDCLSRLGETSLFYQREAKALYRNTAGTAARFVIVLATLIGTIFYGVGRSDPDEASNVMNTFGALVVVGITSSMMGSAQSELMAFPLTKPLFLREYSTNHYSILLYFMARFSVEVFLTALQTAVQCVITYFLIGFQSNFLMFYLAVYAVAMSSTALSVFFWMYCRT